MEDLVIITDIHGNLGNTQRVLDLYPKSQIICLGDITNLWDENVTQEHQTIIKFFAQKEIPCVIGNHDIHVFQNPQTYGIDDESIRFLYQLPVGLTLKTSNNLNFAFFHHKPHDFWGHCDITKMTYEEFCLSYDAEKDNLDMVFIGHLHKPYTLRFSGKNKAIVSVGALKDGWYAVYKDGIIEHKKLIEGSDLVSNH